MLFTLSPRIAHHEVTVAYSLKKPHINQWKSEEKKWKTLFTLLAPLPITGSGAL